MKRYFLLPLKLFVVVVGSVWFYVVPRHYFWRFIPDTDPAFPDPWFNHLTVVWGLALAVAAMILNALGGMD
jgi:hypothetical protein